jgi:hypothetical protein
MSTANLDAADLAAVLRGGLIHEDVMNKIWDISKIPLPLTDRIGSGTVDNASFTWTQDSLGAPVKTGQVVDGSDATGNNTATGARVGNFCEERVKVVRVSTRAQESGTIGFSDALAYQVMMRQQELKRDVEATALSLNPSVADDGNTVAGQTGALDAWLVSNTSNGATGANGGYNTTTGVVDTAVPGTKRALSEAVFKDLLQEVYQEGGEATFVMARPAVVRKFSEYQFTSGARIATMTRDTQGNDSKGSVLGAVNVYIGDFCTVEIVPNRLQLETATATSTMFILAPDLIELVYLSGYRVDPLAKVGLSDSRLMSVDWGLRVGNEKGLAAYRAIDEALAMVA